MAKYRNDLDYTVVLPSIGVTVKPGDVFDGPDALDVPGIVSAGEKGKIKESVSVPTEAVEIEAGE
jgi:hypothetical protein